MLGPFLSRTRALGWLLGAMLLVSPGLATAEESKPILETAPNGHRGAIWDVAYSRDGRYLVSASDDKTARVWDTTTGQTRLVIRGEIGEGDHGKLYAAAISNDGGTVALAGQLASGPPFGDIRLVDIATGEQLSRLQDHRGIIFDLAFSPTGHLLASAGSDRKALIWSYPEGKVTATLDHGSASPERVAFLGEHHVVTIANDDKIRVFNSAGGPVVRTLTMPARPNSLAASGDGGLFAVGDQSGNVKIWTWPDAEAFSEFKVGAAVTALSFGAGRRATELAVGTGDAPYAVSLWDTFKGRKLASYGGLDNIIKAVTFSPDGTFVASAGGNQNRIDIWDPQHPEKARMMLGGGGRSVWGVGFLRTPQGNNDSGTYVAWGYQDPCPGLASCPEKPGKLEFALRLPDERSSHLGSPLEIKDRQIISPSGKGVDFTETQAILELQGARLARTVAPDDDELWPELKVERSGSATVVSARDASKGRDHYAYSFLPDGSAVVSGGRNGIFEILSPRDTTVLHDLSGHEGDVAAVAVSPDGVYLASGSNDQTVRLWNAKTGDLLVSIHHTRTLDEIGIPRDEWIVWTPQGYFIASPGGERLIGWRINKGPDKSAHFVTAEQTRARFRNRDMVESAIRLAANPDAANRQTARGPAPQPPSGAEFVLAEPSLIVSSPKDNGLYRNGIAQLTLQQSPQPAPITRIEVFVNDALVLSHEPAAGDPASLGGWRVVLPLFSGTNDVLIRATNAVGMAVDKRLVISHTGEGRLDRRGTAYVLAIGIDKYPNIPGNDLEFAARDAESFAAAIQPHLGRTHNNPAKVLLLSSNQTDPTLQPTKANILRSLEFLKQAKTEDTAILFVAGHGFNAGPQGYRLIPTDASWTDIGSQVPWQAFQIALNAVSARKLMFIDTCRAAHLTGSSLSNSNTDIATEAAFNRIAFFSSTSGEQDAFEFKEKRHGYFTFGLLEALGGRLHKQGKELTVRQLGWLVSPFVLDQTDGAQLPVLEYPATYPNFPVAKFP